MTKKIEVSKYIGKKINYLFFIEDMGTNEKGRSIAKVKCDCGKIKINRVGDILSGATISCGCYNKKRTIEMATKHGGCGTPEYSIYQAAKARCNNKNGKFYEYYGGRGIKFLYKDFQEFYNDLGKRPSNKHQIDRINNNGNYEVGNCRWATKIENCLNKRVQKNSISGLSGVTWFPRTKKWWARYSDIHLGFFENKFDAFEAYTKKYFELHNKFPPDYRPISIKKENNIWP